MLTLSAVVPCYNEEDSLSELVRRLQAVCVSEAGDSYEIVLVDDGSTDRTWAWMNVLSTRNPHLVIVKMSRNHGHQLALSAGLSVARGARIFILDADLQDPPELLPKMMKLCDDGADVVYGQRTDRSGETWFKRITSKGFYRVLEQLVDVDMPLDTGDFRLITRRVLDLVLAMPERERFFRGMVAWIGLRQVPLEYVRDARFAGETKYPLSKMLGLAASAVTGFSIRPLRIATYLGLITATLALGMLVYALTSWVMYDAVSGWTSLMIVVLFLGAVQLVVLGVMGEYIGRNFLESKQRPNFIIEQVRHQGDARSVDATGAKQSQNIHLL
ncbi:MAG: glycosyltransferase family 2 protein [Pseudomonadota bacterium]